MNSFYLQIATKVLSQVDLAPLRGRKVLITGTNGLLGSHMAAVMAYLNREFGYGLTVTCISRSAPPPWMTTVLRTEGFTFHQMNLGAEEFDLPGDWDYVIHGATYGQPKKFIANAVETMRLNALVTENLLKSATRAKGSFLFMSTSEIYGNPPVEFNPTAENCPATILPGDPRASYTVAKVFGEVLCNLYNSSAMARARVARVSSVYGPGVHLNDDRVLNVFILRALRSGELRLMDAGEQKRKWLYISDGLTMLFYILLHAPSVTYNVSGSGLHSIGDLAHLIGRDVNVPVIFPQAKSSDDEHLKGALNVINLDNHKILHETKLADLVPLEDGVRATIGWLRYLEQGANP